MNIVIAVLLLFYTLYSSGQESRHALSGTWKLIQYKDLRTHNIVKEPPNLKRSVILKFEDDGFQGHIEGHTSKNPINGGYVVGENHAIHFSGVGIQVYNKEGNEWGDNLSKVFLDVSS